MEFDRRLAENRREYPDLARVHGRPMRATVDHQGMEVVVERGVFSKSVVHVGVDALTCGGRTLPLAEVVRAGWFAERGANASQVDLVFQVLTVKRWVTLFRISAAPEAMAAGLTWLADRIHEESARARGRGRREKGGSEDVPDALRAMTRKGREPA
ncbi:MAG: hypothetical protein R3F61_24690 [Myxococcota bacterium]